MTDIPKARELITDARRTINAEITMLYHNRIADPRALAKAVGKLDDALELMTRQILKDPAPPRRGPLTVEEKIEIRDYVARHPEVCFDDIAKKYNCAGGRISEALREI